MKETMTQYETYTALKLKKHPQGIVEIVMGEPGKLLMANHRLHTSWRKFGGQ